MKKENIDRDLNTELKLFNIYAVFVIAANTGTVTILYELFANTIKYSVSFLIIILIVSLIFSIIAYYLLIKSYFKIKKLQKK